MFKKKLVRENILKLTPYRAGKPIDEVRRELKLEKIIKLASNENPLGPAPKAARAIKKSLGNISRYPDGNCFYLKRKLAKKLNIRSSNIIFGNGSNEIIEMIIKTFLNEGEEVIVSKPDFLIFKLTTLQENGVPVEVDLKKFYCDLEAIKNAITAKTKVIFIANPNNPVGTYLKEENLRKFIEQIPDNIILALDEAYYEFAKSHEDYPDSLKFLNKKNIIIMRTFSKAFGLAGLRLGYGLAQEEIINYLNKSRQPFNINYLAQVAGESALENEDFLDKTIKTVNEGKRYLYKELDKLGLRYIPSATNFILIDTGTDSKIIFREMLKRSVIVRDMKAYNLDTWIRVTVGTKKENKKFIKVFQKVIQGG
jgi:histidinol-phosphate aminotransferase